MIDMPLRAPRLTVQCGLAFLCDQLPHNFTPHCTGIYDDFRGMSFLVWSDTWFQNKKNPPDAVLVSGGFLIFNAVLVIFSYRVVGRRPDTKRLNSSWVPKMHHTVDTMHRLNHHWLDQ